MESLPSYELWLWGGWGGSRGLALGCVQLQKGQSLVGWAPPELGLWQCRQESLLTDKSCGWWATGEGHAVRASAQEQGELCSLWGQDHNWAVAAAGAGELGLRLGTGWAAHGWTGPPEGMSCHGTWVSMARHLLGRIKRGVGWVVSSPSQLSQL